MVVLRAVAPSLSLALAKHVSDPDAEKREESVGRCLNAAVLMIVHIKQALDKLCVHK